MSRLADVSRDPSVIVTPYVTDSMVRWRRLTDGPLLILAIGSLPLLLVELERDQLTGTDRTLLDVLNLVVLVAFAIDYVVELTLSSDRWMYVRCEWINALIVVTAAIAVMPQLAVVGGARILRAAPVLRAVVAVLRVLTVGGVAARDGRRLIRRRAGTVAISLAIMTWLSAAAAFTLAEDVGAAGRIESFQDALWWSATTITTVGYGDITPITTAGRLVGLVTMVVGISTFAVVTAKVAAFLVKDESADTAAEQQQL